MTAPAFAVPAADRLLLPIPGHPLPIPVRGLTGAVPAFPDLLGQLGGNLEPDSAEPSAGAPGGALEVNPDLSRTKHKRNKAAQAESGPRSPGGEGGETADPFCPVSAAPPAAPPPRLPAGCAAAVAGMEAGRSPASPLTTGAAIVATDSAPEDRTVAAAQPETGGTPAGLPLVLLRSGAGSRPPETAAASAFPGPAAAAAGPLPATPPAAAAACDSSPVEDQPEPAKRAASPPRMPADRILEITGPRLAATGSSPPRDPQFAAEVHALPACGIQGSDARRTPGAADGRQPGPCVAAALRDPAAPAAGAPADTGMPASAESPGSPAPSSGLATPDPSTAAAGPASSPRTGVNAAAAGLAFALRLTPLAGSVQAAPDPTSLAASRPRPDAAGPAPDLDRQTAVHGAAPGRLTAEAQRSVTAGPPPFPAPSSQGGGARNAGTGVQDAPVSSPFRSAEPGASLHSRLPRTSAPADAAAGAGTPVPGPPPARAVAPAAPENGTSPRLAAIDPEGAHRGPSTPAAEAAPAPARHSQEPQVRIAAQPAATPAGPATDVPFVPPGPAREAALPAVESRARQTAPARPADAPVPLPVPQPAARDISLRLSGSGEQVQVRVVERDGEVRVAVRTADPELARSLRQDLPELSARLEREGLRAEGWHPATASERPAGGEARGGGFADRGQPGSPGQRDERRQPPPPPAENPEGGRDEAEDFAGLVSSAT